MSPPSPSAVPTTTTTSVCTSLTVKKMEECRISPPPVITTTLSHSQSLPLTFLDIPWLQFPPLQPLLFFQLPTFDYHYPTTTTTTTTTANSFSHFTDTVLPRLKRSLSSALQQFFPFAGKLTVAHTIPDSLVFTTDSGSSSKVSDSVGLTVSLCDVDFNDAYNYLPMSAHLFHQLVPALPNISSSTLATSPANLLSIHITFFPTSTPGFSIGFASHPVLCDQRTFSNFLYSWASFCKSGHMHSPYPPIFDRSVILDSAGLQPILFKQWLGLESSNMKRPPAAPAPVHGLFRSTFVVGPTDIANAKRWILAHCDELNRSYPVLLSPYVVTCALLWTCFLRAQAQNIAVTKAKTKGPTYFGFIAGGITRFPFQVPRKYFGNCVGFGRAVAKRDELLQEDEGMSAAADAIGHTIKKLDTDILGAAENWISDWQTLLGSEDHIHVVGSPKVNLYETDFGWGRPKKIEEISSDHTRAISLTQSRDMEGGMEIGLSLPKPVMDAFSTLFTQGIRDFARQR